jgi:DNA-binding LytR/AlgR family response regulator
MMERHVMSTLIVDDEPIARQVLREGLETLREVLIVGEAENGKQALQQIAALKPDLVLLDLQMPVMNGFEVVRKLGVGYLPVIVIITAFDQHAIEAFEAGAVDYLLKPVSEERLGNAIERARRLLKNPLAVANDVANITSTALPGHSGHSRKIVGKDAGEYLLLDASEILAFQAEGELVWIVTEQKRFLATQTLHVIEDRLREQQFQRVHRNAIVNLNHVQKMSTLSSQRWLVTLSNSLQLVVSKRQARGIRGILHW